MVARLDNYDGSPDEYVKYLEETIILLRQHHSSCSFAARLRSVQSSTPVAAAEDTIRPLVSPNKNAPASPRSQNLPCSARPPNGLLPQKRGREFEFVAFDTKSLGEQRIASRPKKIRLRWKDNALALIQDTPQAKDWHLALKDKGLYDILCSGNAVVYLLDTKHDFHAFQPSESLDGATCSGRLNQIKLYAKATMQKQIRAGVVLALANFQMFLVLSSCAVLLEVGDAPAEIFEIVRICIGREASTERCRDVLKACRYLNKLADSLYMQGWGLRAGEAILLWSRPPPFYYHLSCAAEASIGFIGEKLCTKNFVAHVANPKPWTSIFVPNFVDQMLGKSVHVGKISQILGYKHSEFFFDRVNPWKYPTS